MVWNAARPADSDRIRLSATLIRDNWTAIENGSAPYDAISLENQLSPIDKLDGHNRLYGYTNLTSGQVELSSINSAGSLVLLTEGGRLGSLQQSAIFASVQTGSLSFDASFSYSGSLMPTARVSCEANGTSSMTVNMSASQIGTGRYRLTIPAGILTVNSYALLCQPRYNSSSDSVFIDVVSKPIINPVTPTIIDIEVIYRSDGSKVNSGFDAVVIGGRP